MPQAKAKPRRSSRFAPCSLALSSFRLPRIQRAWDQGTSRRLASAYRAASTLLLLFASAANALAPGLHLSQLDITTWDTRNGLPQSVISSITQTRDGYLWIGTQQGLARFDGTSFETFRPMRHGLLHDQVDVLLADGAGGFWLGTPRGLGRYRPTGDDPQHGSGSFSALGAEVGLPATAIHALVHDERGRLWIGTPRGLFVQQGDRFTPLPLDGPPAGEQLARDRAVTPSTVQDTAYVNALLHVGSTLWIGTRGGLRSWDGETLLDHGGPATGGPTAASADIRALLYDDTGTLWVGTANGLAIFADDAWQPASPQPPDPEFHSAVEGAAHALPSGTINQLLQDPQGVLWIAADTGLWRLPGSSEPRLGGSRQVLGQAHRLPTDSIRCLYLDPAENLWVGTFLGLVHLRQPTFTPWTPAEGLSASVTSSLAQDSEGGLWIGTQQGLNRLSPDGTISTYGPAQGLSNDFVVSLLVDTDDSLWVGTRDGLFHRQGGRFLRYGPEAGPAVGPVHGFVMSLLRDRNGVLWVGTRGGLSRFDGQSWRSFGLEDGLTHPWVHVIDEDADGNLWFGTRAGLTRLAPGGTLTPYRPDVLRQAMVFDLHRDGFDDLWVGTYGDGLFWFPRNPQVQQNTGPVHHFTEAEGLPDDFVFRVLRGDKGQLWISHNRGIYSLDREQLTELVTGQRSRLQADHFSLNDGLPASGCTGGHQPAGLRDRDGFLWFPTLGGAVRIDPSQLAPSVPLPPPRFVSAVVNSTRRVDLTGGEELRLHSHEDDLELRFTGISPGRAERLRYRYRLDRDGTWSDLGTDRHLFLTNLEPGHHVLTLEATFLGAASGGIASLDFQRQRPYHLSWWFYAILGAVVGLSTLTIHHLRIRKLKGHTRSLEQRVAARTAEVSLQSERLAAANRRLQALDREKDEIIALAAHDLRAPLVNLRGFAGELRRSLPARTQVETDASGATPRSDQLDPEVWEALNFIDQAAARLDQLLDSFLHFTRLSRRQPRAREVDLRDLVRQPLNDLQQELAARHVEVRVSGLPRLSTDRDFVRIIFDNLLRHALHQLPDQGGCISISARELPRMPEDTGELHQYGPTWHFEVWHDGRRLERDDMSRVFRLFGRLGASPGAGAVSLAYAQSLVYRLGGELWFQSGATGTAFCFTLPALAPERPSVQQPAPTSALPLESSPTSQPSPAPPEPPRPPATAGHAPADASPATASPPRADRPPHHSRR